MQIFFPFVARDIRNKEAKAVFFFYLVVILLIPDFSNTKKELLKVYHPGMTEGRDLLRNRQDFIFGRPFLALRNSKT